MKPEKDISRMSSKRLKFRYGESDGTDKLAEDELRRRGLTDVELRQVIYGYQQGKYRPRSGADRHPDKKPAEKKTPPDKSTTPKAASDKKPIMHFGPFKGLPLDQVPGWHLEWCYGSFSKGRRRLEKELRSRGYEDGDFRRCRRHYRVLGKSRKKQAPKD